MKQRRPVKRGPWYIYTKWYDPEMGHIPIWGGGCSDRMCGAEDCFTCNPGMNWRDQQEGDEDDDSCAE